MDKVTESRLPSENCVGRIVGSESMHRKRLASNQPLALFGLRLSSSSHYRLTVGFPDPWFSSSSRLHRPLVPLSSFAKPSREDYSDLLVTKSSSAISPTQRR